MSNDMALRLSIGFLLFAALVVWWLNRPEKPRMVRTSEWRVANRERQPHWDRRPTWREPASKGIHGRRRA